MRKLLNILLYGMGGILVLLLVLVGFSQTQLFRDRIRALALSNLQTLLDADVRLGDLRGNLLTGFSVDSVAVDVRGEPFCTADRLNIRYNLFEVPGKRISVQSFSLIRPRIRLVRHAGSRWNFEEMVRPTPEDTTPARPLSWVIDVRSLEIRDGTIELLDSAALASPAHEPPETGTVEYHRFALRHVNLSMSAFVSREEKRAEIANLAFLSDSPRVELKRLAGRFLVNTNEARAADMVLMTDRSDIRLSASMREFDLLAGTPLRQFKRNPVELSLSSKELDLDELNLFLPPLRFLHGRTSLNLEAKGEFGDLRVQKLDLRFGHSELELRGTVTNLHDPENLALNVKLTESKILLADPLALMPALNLPDFSPLGVTTVNLEFEGRPADFRTKFLLETTAGNIQSDIELKIGGPRTLRYRGGVFVQRLDLAPLLGDRALQTQLTGNVRLEGEGVALGDMSSHFAVEFDSSIYGGLPLTHARVTAETEGKVLNSSLQVVLAGMRSDLHATFDERLPSRPRVSVEGQVSALNLEHLLRDASANSDLSFSVKAEGGGSSWSRSSGEVQLDFSPSRYRDYQIASGEIRLSLDQDDTLHKQLTLQSDIADLSLNGSFDLQYLGKLLAYEWGNLRRSVGSKFAMLNSTAGVSGEQSAAEALGKQLAAEPFSLDAAYTLTIKDLEPISLASDNRTFNGSGTLQGRIKGGYRNLALQAKLDVTDFYLGTADAGTLVRDAEVTLDLRRLLPVHPLSNLEVQIAARASRLNLNRTEFDSAEASWIFALGQGTFSAGCTVNGDTRISCAGDDQVREDTVLLRLLQLRYAVQDYSWSSDQPAIVKISGSGVSVKGLALQRGDEQVTLDGALERGGKFEAALAARRIDLEGLSSLIQKVDQRAGDHLLGGIASATVQADGTLDQPIITAAVAADSMTFRGALFGHLRADCTYRDTLLVARINVDSGATGVSTGNELAVSGSLPVNLAIGAVEERLPERGVDLKVLSTNFRMDILDPLLPTFNDLRGQLRCDVSVSGTVQHPRYHGTLSVDQCSFLFVPNNIHYLFDGTFRPEGERITVVDATVRNVPADERGGRKGLVHLTGDFSLRDLKPTDFDLTATGKLLVVKETTGASALSMAGNLFVQIDPAGLHFTGTLEQSLLKGYLLITNSTLIFPPTKSAPPEESALSVPVSTIDDTTKAQGRRSMSAEERYFGQAGKNTAGNGGSQSGIPAKSFLDGVRYDLTIDASGGTTEIRMIFNQTTNEELVANIEGKFRISDDGRKWFGDLGITRAYYNFIKRFDASGTIKFMGDFMNPGLDLTATYEGTRKDTAGLAEKVVVSIKITGTRSEPKIDISMTINQEDYQAYTGPKSNDVQSDAIQFILTGSFPLTSSQKGDAVADVQSSVRSSLLTGAAAPLTSMLSEFLRANTGGGINSIELGLGESTDVRMSGTALNGVWRYKGKIMEDPLSNANFSLLYSFGSIFDALWMRNIMFELERKVEAVNLGQNNDMKRTNSARLFYRISF